MDFVYKVIAYVLVACLFGFGVVVYDYLTHDKKKKK